MDSRFAVSATVIWTLLYSSHLAAQPRPKLPSSEVISVKPNLTDDTRSTRRALSAGVHLTNVTVERLLSYAFNVEPALTQFAFQGGSKSVLSSRFDVSIMADRSITPADEASLMQQVLVSRFGLLAHRQMMERPVYELRPVSTRRLGPSLKAATVDCSTFFAQRGTSGAAEEPRNGRNEPLCTNAYGFGPELRIRYASTMAELVRRIQGFVDRPIIEATGLQGSYEWEIRFALGDARDDQSTSIYTAVSEQLGLTLRPTTAPFPVIVIERLHLPDAN
jgi:uncharacterized protein (TIGR03435 family)